jgi:hypothetical protein
MKTIICIVCALWLHTGTLSAQLFQQQSTQQQLLVQQLAALKAYASTARQGYQGLSRGLTTIKDITQGEWSLHQAFFAALANINPQILQYVQKNPALPPVPAVPRR